MRPFKYFFYSVLCVGIAVVLVIFSWQNNAQVELCFASHCTKSGYLSGYILVTFFLGMIFSTLFLTIPFLKMNSTKSNLKKQLKKYEKELQALRNQPLDDLPKNQSVEVATLVEQEENNTKTPYIHNP